MMFVVDHLFSYVVVFHSSLLIMRIATSLSLIQPNTQIRVPFSKQLNHFHHQFVKTKAEFDINALFILRIHIKIGN